MNEKTITDLVISKEVRDLASKLLGSSCKEIGEIFGDELRSLRFKNQLRLYEKTIRILKDKNIKPKSVEMKVLFPLLSAATLEDDEEMIDRWASLLVSAADPNEQNTPKASFVEILKQLRPRDAFVLDVFYDQINHQRKIPTEKWAEDGVRMNDMREMLKIDEVQFQLVVDNLLRLRLVDHPSFLLDVVNGNDVRLQVTSSGILCATQLGSAFIAACGKKSLKDLLRSGKSHSYGIPSDSVQNIYALGGRAMHSGFLKINTGKIH